MSILFIKITNWAISIMHFAFFLLKNICIQYIYSVIDGEEKRGSEEASRGLVLKIETKS